MTANADQPTLAGEQLIGAAIVVAGGHGRRVGGLDKPAILVDGSSLIERVLTSVRTVPIVVVVGPPRPLSRPVIAARESPPGGGPAAAVCAGVAALLASGTEFGVVAVLAADLPALTSDTLDRLVAALRANPTMDGALLADHDHREQLLLGVWRADRLADACAQRQDWTGQPLRTLLAPLSRLTLDATGDEASDIDTLDDLQRWTH